MDVLSQLVEQICLGQQDRVRELVREAIEQDIAVARILSQGLIPGMDLVGEKFQTGEYFIPNMLLAARAMKGALDTISVSIILTSQEPHRMMLTASGLTALSSFSYVWFMKSGT